MRQKKHSEQDTQAMNEALPPLRQGKDRLCGVYALLNTYRLLVPQDSWDPQQLFNDSITWLNRQKLLLLAKAGNTASARSGVPSWLNRQTLLLDAVTSGLEVGHLLGMIDDVFKPAFPFIEVYQVWGKKRIRDKNGLNPILEYVAPPSSTVLACYTCTSHGHWTVFQKFDEKKIYLYDSDGRGYVNLPLSKWVSFYQNEILVFRNTNLS